MRERLSTVLPVCQISPGVFVWLDVETNHTPDHEFPQVLKDFISHNFEPDAKLTNLADRK